MMKHVSFSPNLYTIACQFYVMFLGTFKREGHPVWTNWPTCLQVDLHEKKTKTCKLCNESKTPHICWLQGYLEYEWRFPRVQSSSSKLISGHRKRPVTCCANSIDPKTKFITFVFVHLLERIKWLSTIWILKIKLFPIMCLYSCSYMFSCKDLVHVPTHYRLFTTHSWCDWNSKQQWDKKLSVA